MIVRNTKVIRRYLAVGLAVGGITLSLSSCGGNQITPDTQAQLPAQVVSQADMQERISRIEPYLVFDKTNHLSLKQGAEVILSKDDLNFAKASIDHSNQLVASGEWKYGSTPTSALKLSSSNTITAQGWGYTSGWWSTDVGCVGWAETEMNWWGRYIGGDTCIGNHLKYKFNSIGAVGGGFGAVVGAALGGVVGAGLGWYPGWVFTNAANEIDRQNWGNGVKVYIYVANLWIGVEHRW